MNLLFRRMLAKDKQDVLQMMREFYSSEAVFTNGSDEIFETDYELCVSNNPLLEGYIIEFDGTVCGYTMIAQSFSTEFGKICYWLEDLYLKPNFRGKKIIPQFIEYIKSKKDNAILKLEVEKENSHALHVYKKQGFQECPYCEMIRH